MHIHRAASGTEWPPVEFGTWRLWDTDTAWPWLEPKKGEWHFERLDGLVALAERNRVEVVLVLGLSPAWASARPDEKCSYAPGFAAEPKDLADWGNYVRTVARRYKGRIRYYETWNEPNLKGFYTGTTAKLLELVREARLALKEVDPDARVISPSATGGTMGIQWLEEFLARGGGDSVDIIGYHFYVAPGPPEAMVPLVKRVRDVAARHGVGEKPLWNTETGWMIEAKTHAVPTGGTGRRGRVLDETEAAGYLARTFLLGWALGIDRVYWYAWDNRDMGLVQDDGKTLKLPAVAYEQVRTWLAGARMDRCGPDLEGTWTCSLFREPGYMGWISWNPDRKVDLDPPEEVQRLRDLSGRKYPVRTGETVEVGPSPILLETRDP